MGRKLIKSLLVLASNHSMNIPDIWTKDKAVGARDFFNSPTGKMMIEIALANRPVVHPDKPDSVVAREAIARQTWEDCINGLAQFTIEPDDVSESEHRQFDMSDKGFTSKKPGDKK
jgi:hypothetical protein